MKVKRVVYSASSSAYGDTEKIPQQEDDDINPMSPYAMQKYYGEVACKMFCKVYNIETVSLRYFNVYGERQSMEGAYALVVAAFARMRLNNLPLTIEKLDLTNLDISDKLVSILVTRCQNLKSLCLWNCKRITLETVSAVIQHLKQTLEELDLSYSDLSYSNVQAANATLAKVFELKSMPKLEVFNCHLLKNDITAILKNKLPHLTINEKGFGVGLTNGAYKPEDGFWEIEAKQLKTFSEITKWY